MSNHRKELYIFVTSPRPDPYINVLAHTLSSFPVSTINFVVIQEHGYATEQEQDRAFSTMTNVLNMLHALSVGTYIHGETSEQLPQGGASVYADCLNKLQSVQVSHSTVRWADLQEALSEYNCPQAIFDVTALKKNLLVDVVALLLSKENAQIYFLELIKTPTYDSADLVHAMVKDQDYAYRWLADSRHVELAIKRIRRRSLTLRDLLIITGVVVLFVVGVQVFLPITWAQSAIVGVGTATSIASWFFMIRR